MKTTSKQQLKVPLAELTENGLRQFEKLIVTAPRLSVQQVEENVIRIASSHALSRPVVGGVDVALFPDLSTRLDTAQWVDGLLAGVDLEVGPATGAEQLFSWLAMIALPQLCKRSKAGRLSVKDAERYIQGRKERDFYRHLVSGPYWMHKRFGQFSRLFLCQPAFIMPEVQEQIVSRRWLRESDSVIEVLHRLYWDEDAEHAKADFTATDRTSDPKPGMGKTIPRPGTLRALEVFLGQLQCTHDLQSMTVRQLLEMLPAEFDLWLKSKK